MDNGKDEVQKTQIKDSKVEELTLKKKKGNQQSTGLYKDSIQLSP